MAKTAFSHLEIRLVASSFLIAMFYILIIVIIVNSKNLSKQGFKTRFLNTLGHSAGQTLTLASLS